MDTLHVLDQWLGECERRGRLDIHGSPQVIATVSRQEIAAVREAVRRLIDERFGKAGEIRLGPALVSVLGAERARLLIEEAFKEGKIDALSAQLFQIGVDMTPFVPPTSPLWGFDRLMQAAFGRGLKLM